MNNKIAFTPAVRANVPLLLGFSGGTGSGKTFTAMEVATGLAGEKKFAVIDTENGRALHYADRFNFDHAELRAPFRPDAYLDAIIAADEAGYPAVLVDSTSHVWAGDGGVLDWQEEELDRMAGTDWKKREACKMAAWIKPKVAHKRMVSRLLQMRCHVILCFRAEQKVEMKRDENGKMRIEAKESPTGLHGWIPTCEKNLPFELTASFLLTADRPGVVKPIKLQEQHRTFFPLDRATNRETGRQLAEWARGGVGSAATNTSGAPVDLQALSDVGETKARAGLAALKAWWVTIPVAAKTALKSKLDGEWKRLAEEAGEAGGTAA
jgi:hypothetical protein